MKGDRGRIGMSGTAATESKRRDLLLVVQRLLAPEACVKGVLAVGSVATGHARPDSDIDVIVFMDPVDHHVVPTEAIWCPWDGSFHSIFVKDDRIRKDGIQLDVMVRSLQKWQAVDFEWPDEDKAGLAQAWIAYDPEGRIRALIDSRTAYSDAIRQRRLDAAVVDFDEALKGDLYGLYERIGPVRAFGRLSNAFDAFVELLFAYNRRWRFLKKRELEYIETLPWVPDNFPTRLLSTMSARVADPEAAFRERAEAIRSLYAEVLVRLKREGVYRNEPVREAFMRLFDDPGRSWNLDEWGAKHRTRGKRPAPLR
jgi:hypothetical protein